MDYNFMWYVLNVLLSFYIVTLCNENYSISCEMEVDLTYNVVDNEEDRIVYLNNNNY